MIEMHVAGIGVDSTNGQSIIVLGDSERRLALPIWVGPAEYNAIAFALSGQEADRPLTHDLLLRVLNKFDARILQVEVGELDAQTFMASIRMTAYDPRLDADIETVIDARPSDAIALAIKVGAPIFVSEQVVAGSTVPADTDKDQKEREEFSKFVQDVKASDFKLPPEKSAS